MKQKPQDLSGLRAARLPLLAERAALQAKTRDRDQATAEVDAYCASAAAEISGRLAYTVATGEGLADAFAVRARPDGRVDLGPLLAVLLGPKKLAATLAPFADALPASTDRAGRATRLAEIGTELAAIEEAEDVEVCRLEALGLSPGRRADANPAIVLKRRG